MSENAKTVLIYPRWTVIVGTLGFVFFSSLALLPALPSDYVPKWIILPATSSETLWGTGVLGAFALLGAYLTASYFWERHELSRNGVASRSVLGGRKMIRWPDILSVQYCQYPRAWFRLEDRSGTVIRVSFLFPDLSDFAQLTLQAAPDASMDATTRTVLRAVALGHAPPMRLS